MKSARRVPAEIGVAPELFAAFDRRCRSRISEASLFAKRLPIANGLTGIRETVLGRAKATSVLGGKAEDIGSC